MQKYLFLFIIYPIPSTMLVNQTQTVRLVTLELTKHVIPNIHLSTIHTNDKNEITLEKIIKTLRSIFSLNKTTYIARNLYFIRERTLTTTAWYVRIYNRICVCVWIKKVRRPKPKRNKEKNRTPISTRKVLRSRHGIRTH